jgi:hypothetical protein
MESKCIQINTTTKNVLNTTQLLLSSFARSPLQDVVQPTATEQDVVLSGTIPHLEFTLEIQSNNLTYQGNPYTEYQQFLYTLIKSLHDKGYGYRRISHKLNKWGLQTPRGKTWFNTSVSSILKRKHERDIRIQDTRNKEFPVKIGKFRLNYYTY